MKEDERVYSRWTGHYYCGPRLDAACEARRKKRAATIKRGGEE